MKELVLSVEIGVRATEGGPYTYIEEPITIPTAGQNVPILTKQVVEMMTKWVVDNPQVSAHAGTKTLRDLADQEDYIRCSLAEWRKNRGEEELHSWFSTHACGTVSAVYLDTR